MAVWHDGLCAIGRAVLILVINATGEKTPLPPELRERILALDPALIGEVRNETRRHRHL